MKKLFGLGKGLNSLIPDAKHITPDIKKDSVFYVEINKVRPNPQQPRHDFDDEGLKELSKSIRKYGVLQPLLVSKVEEESNRGMNVYYQLIAGERRLRASKQAGLPHVPVIIRDDLSPEGGDKRVALEVALIENLQRTDLNPLEEAEAYDRLAKEFGLTQKEIAEKVAKSREVVANAIRLLNLPKDIRESLRSGKLSRAHARALLAFSDETKQREMYKQILAGGVSSREVESIASTAKKGKSSAKKDSKFLELEKNLADTLKTPVLIHSTEKGGKIVIRFATLQDLNKIAKSIID
ncbi:MAG: ParB/RepB/Spo0J family partition protein [Candidatus Yanofskybacteria bacterium]|nr:ParB/RepB/Spo0J family partition protein [Candidatus Yanofskybacteria bacterium]